MSENLGFEEPLEEVSVGESCYVDDSELELEKLLCKYTQNSSIKGITRRFALYDKTHLFQQKDSHFKKIPKHRVDLTFLNPEPNKHLFISWKILLSGTALLGLSILLFLYSDALESLLGGQSVLLAAVLLFTTGFIFVLVSLYRSYSTLVYHSDIGQVPLLVVAHKPRDTNYKKFIDIIGKCINYSRNRQGVTPQERIKGEMKDLRRLKELNIISEHVYDEAQRKILANIK